MKNWIDWRPLVVCLESPTCASRAAQVFCEEIILKTGFTLELSDAYLRGRSNVVLCTRESFDALSLYGDRIRKLDLPGSEGFTLLVIPEGGFERSVFIVGADPRGIFFGMGKLLRLLYLAPETLLIDAAQRSFTSTPKYPMRGQQLAYRDKQNTCPCWTQHEFDRYIRDLALFGNNAIEILPPRTDDNLFSRVFQVDPFDMMLDLSRIIHSYGMDVWLWYPNMGEHYESPQTRAAELAEREKVFSAIPYLDAVLIPAGDPGDLEPDLLFPVAEETAHMLHKYHPNATIWLAPQVFAPTGTWYEDFYSAVDKEPEWLYGLCFAPWEQHTIEEMQARLPAKYKHRIRHYPDITHNIASQFAMPRWDRAFGIFEGRECNNTRPRAMKYIHNLHAPYTVGSITYSEGIHDDVNKFVWSQQDWDDTQPAEETVREYVRYLIDPALEDALTRGLFSLENNWDQAVPVAENTAVDDTYRLFAAMEASAKESTRANYRFLLALLRAYSDYYIRHKQMYDDRLENEAINLLKQAAALGADNAMRAATITLNLGVDQPWDETLHDRLLELSDILHTLCGIKLTTHHHSGQFFRRGAYLDLIDFPLNNKQYLTVSFRSIRKLPTEAEKIAAINALLHRTDPGEGGIYCNMGSYESLPYLEIAHSWADDPGMLRTAYISTCIRAVNDAHLLTGTYREAPIAREWFTHAVTYYDTPLVARFEGLDISSRYQLKLVYIQPGRSHKIRLTTGTGAVIHDIIEARASFDPIYVYQLPPDAYRDGTLVLRWQAYDMTGGVNVNEVFIEKI